MRALLLVLAACTSAASPPQVAAPTLTPPAVAAAPAPTKDQIIERSHAVLLAYDHAEIAPLEAAWSDRMLHFEGGKPSSRADELAQLKKRPPGELYVKARTWTDEHVQLSTDDAVFIGKATEVQGGNDSHGGYRYLGWYMLQWAREGSAWKLRLWTWQRAGRTQSETWNDIFRNDSGFEKQPNQLMVEIVKPIKPGTALDLAMGQGRNALYLAAQGWKTTGIDFADEGVRIARAEADRRKLTLTTVVQDIDKWDFGNQKWDLITMIYPGDNHVPWIEKSKVALNKSGLFVLEFFAGEPGDDDGGYQPGQLAKLFGDGFTILRDDRVDGRPDWARDQAKLVRFVARKNR